jgi:putative ABC transport system permease protein
MSCCVWAGAGALSQTGQAIFVTGNYFRVLGVTLSAGAGLPSALAADDPAPPMVAVISHALWQEQLHGSTAALGTTIEVNGVAVTIAGVALPNFMGTNDGISKQVWLPMAALAAIENRNVRAFASYDSTFLRVVARLQPGVTIDDAQTVVASIALRTKQLVVRPDERILPHADVVPVRYNNDDRDSGNESTVLAALFGGITLLILLITCANVSAILVGLAVARRREIAVRLSLGAARVRLVRQLVTECVLRATAAGGLGAFVVWFLIQVFRSRFEDAQIVLNWPALAFTAGFAIVTGILFGLSPALHATRLAISDVLKDSAGTVAAGRSRLQRALVVGQIALTQPLLVGLGAFILLLMARVNDRRSMLNEQIVSVEFNVSASNASGPQIRETMSRLQQRISILSDVDGVVQNTNWHRTEDVAVHPADRVPGIEYRDFRIKGMLTAGGYFDLMDIPFVRGRDFTPLELESFSPAASKVEILKTAQPAVIIGSDLARQLWGAANPIGRRLVEVDSNPEEFVVVGVVDAEIAGDSNDGGFSTRVYLPSTSRPTGLYVRTHGPGNALIPLIRSVVTAEAPELPISMMRTLAASEQIRRTRLLRTSAAAAGGGLLALLLSAIGLYAVVAFAVGHCVREIGVRTALGADRRQVVGLFFFQGIRLSFIGLAIGPTQRHSTAGDPAHKRQAHSQRSVGCPVHCGIRRHRGRRSDVDTGQKGSGRGPAHGVAARLIESLRRAGRRVSLFSF